jgi:hypothetical protein
MKIERILLNSCSKSALCGKGSSDPDRRRLFPSLSASRSVSVDPVLQIFLAIRCPHACHSISVLSSSSVRVYQFIISFLQIQDAMEKHWPPHYPRRHTQHTQWPRSARRSPCIFESSLRLQFSLFSNLATNDNSVSSPTAYTNILVFAEFVTCMFCT